MAGVAGNGTDNGELRGELFVPPSEKYLAAMLKTQRGGTLSVILETDGRFEITLLTPGVAGPNDKFVAEGNVDQYEVSYEQRRTKDVP